MKRREFLRATGAVAAGGPFAAEALVSAQTTARPAPGRANPLPRALMKVGTQHGDSDAILRVLAGFGVNHICSRLPSTRFDEKWSVDSLSRFREHVESFGITLDMMPLPMSSNDISRFELPNIM